VVFCSNFTESFNVDSLFVTIYHSHFWQTKYCTNETLTANTKQIESEFFYTVLLTYVDIWFSMHQPIIVGSCCRNMLVWLFVRSTLGSFKSLKYLMCVIPMLWRIMLTCSWILVWHIRVIFLFIFIQQHTVLLSSVLSPDSSECYVPYFFYALWCQDNLNWGKELHKVPFLIRSVIHM